MYRMKIIRQFFGVLVVGFALPGLGYAACSNPTGAEGTQIYNGDYKTMQYCNGTNWIAMNGGPSGQWDVNGTNVFHKVGNVGIGTSTPSHELEISSTFPTIQLTYSNGAAHVELRGFDGGSNSAGFDIDPVPDVTTGNAEETDLQQHLTQMLENAQYNQDVPALAEVIHTHYLQRQLMHLGGNMQHEAASATDPETTHDVIEQTSSELFNLAETGNAANTVQDLKTPLKNVIEHAEAARTRGGSAGLPTGFTDLDNKIAGLQNSDLIILAARPSMGKSALALNICYNIARSFQQGKSGGSPVGFFSLEMSAEQLVSRMLCTASGINSMSLINGKLRDDEFGRIVAASNELSEMPMYIDDTPGLSITALRSRARRMKRQYGIGLLVVDYLSLLSGTIKSNGDNRVQEISQISMTLKSIARELNIPVLALSQLSRAVEQRDNKRPQLSDLRESGSIEQDADIVMFIYREDYYLEKQLGTVEIKEGEETSTENSTDDGKMAKLQARLNEVRNKAEILVSKNRKGATGAVALQFQPDTTTFHNYSPRH